MPMSNFVLLQDEHEYEHDLEHKLKHECEHDPESEHETCLKNWIV
jgi:hypothetical protein